MRVLKSLGHKNSQLFLGMRSSNKHQIVLKWGIFNASVLLNEHEHPLFLISKLKFSYDKYSVDKVWTKIYCHFYFRGITLKNQSWLRSHYAVEMWKRSFDSENASSVYRLHYAGGI